MTTKLLTLEHLYCERGKDSLFSAAGQVSVTEALDAATDRLEAVLTGLAELMNIPACSNQAALIFYAAESAIALVYAGHAGLECYAAKEGAA